MDRSDGCPLWWVTRWTNGSEEKEIAQCGLVQLPHYLTEVIKASNRPAAAIESTRNEIAVGLARVAESIPRLAERIQAPMLGPNEKDNR